ncbi:hypothetical protein FPHYL_1174 [Fusarium phyllophilum]|uniref:Apple domain-containing protein n=1 Tax=Fusarium phyllophilum TaxID=47803 RepID=A0A8H5KDA5_9HYPO|nr:hypothetical protein FPHYL_1174 [Fusarium phyllophilum]
MIAQNVLAAFVGLAVGVQAGPCKPSSVTTTTGTASTDVTSINSIATSGEPTTTTTEAASTTTSPGEYVCLKDPAPAGKGCNAQGGGQGDLQLLGNVNTLTLASCYKSCLDRLGCIAISLQPGSWCALWAGSFTGTSGGESAWSWYDMDCFCDESSTTTNGLATATTATEATTTTAAPGESCVNNEKNPLPADRPCNKQGTPNQNSNLQYLSSLYDITTVSLCREACRDADGCTAFLLQPGDSCLFYSGTFDGVNEAELPYAWWSMDCFCDESSTTTSGSAIELTTSSVELTSTTETAPATTTTTGAELTYSCPGGFPADSTCDVKYNHIGGSVGRIVGEAEGEALASLDNCVQACVANKDCDFFAFWPNTFCELWEGNYESSDAPVQWGWYELSCFCVPRRDATTTVAMTTEATTTTQATTTTTATLGESCLNNEKIPAPSDKVCNKHGLWSGTAMELLDIPAGLKTKESCREACQDASECTYFAYTPGQICYIYSGNIESVTDGQTDYIWYDMDCFCDLDETDY